MYEYITGRIETLTPASVVVEAAGVGYFLNISLQTFSQIGSRTEVKLYTHFAVREDAQVLYGFFSRAERDIFRSLIGVSGVGGNTARMIVPLVSNPEYTEKHGFVTTPLCLAAPRGILTGNHT